MFFFPLLLITSKWIFITSGFYCLSFTFIHLFYFILFYLVKNLVWLLWGQVHDECLSWGRSESVWSAEVSALISLWVRQQMLMRRTLTGWPGLPESIAISVPLRCSFCSADRCWMRPSIIRAEYLCQAPWIDPIKRAVTEASTSTYLH